MSWSERGLGGRLLAALLCAVVALVALDRCVRRSEAATPRTWPLDMPALPEALQAIGRPALGVVLCARIDAAPEAAAPVLQVLADGGLVLRRPPPLPRGPEPPAPALAALVLPVWDVARLTPAQRGCVVEALGRMLGGAPAPGRVRLVGVRASDADLEALLRWVR